MLLVLGDLTGNLATFFPGHLVARLLGYLALNLILDSLTALLRYTDAHIGLNIVTLLLGNGILDLLLFVVALLFVNSLALLAGNILAFLSGDLLTLVPGHLLANLLV